MATEWTVEENNDDDGNSVYILDSPYGDYQTCYQWHITPKVKNNVLWWTIEESTYELLPECDFDFPTLEEAKRYCEGENKKIREDEEIPES